MALPPEDPAQGSHAEAMSEADLAQISAAWVHLIQGEKTAETLESNLTGLEKKIDDLLASVEEKERERLGSTSSGAKKMDEKANADANGDGSTKS